MIPENVYVACGTGQAAVCRKPPLVHIYYCIFSDQGSAFNSPILEAARRHQHFEQLGRRGRYPTYTHVAFTVPVGMVSSRWVPPKLGLGSVLKSDQSVAVNLHHKWIAQITIETLQVLVPTWTAQPSAPICSNGSTNVFCFKCLSNVGKTIINHPPNHHK